MLPLLEDAARQPDKPFERGAAIGVEPDMLVMRPGPPRHDGLAEVERARRPLRIGEAGDDLVDAGIGERRFVLDDCGQRRNVGLGVGEAIDGDANRPRIQQRQIALHIDYRVVQAARIDPPDRLVNAVRTGGVVRVGHDRLPAR